MKHVISILFSLYIATTGALADDWQALETPGAIAIMRHALAPGTSDPANFKLDDCSTQRNLDARGQAQARAIGQAMRDRGVIFDRVLSSQWCRTMETARLLDLGTVQEVPALNSFFQDRSTRDVQTEAVRDIILNTNEKLFLVSHFVNIAALTGESTSSGEVLILRATNGTIELLGRINIAP